jgi:hypothetical protein
VFAVVVFVAIWRCCLVIDELVSNVEKEKKNLPAVFFLS